MGLLEFKDVSSIILSVLDPLTLLYIYVRSKYVREYKQIRDNLDNPEFIFLVSGGRYLSFLSYLKYKFMEEENNYNFLFDLNQNRKIIDILQPKSKVYAKFVFPGSEEDLLINWKSIENMECSDNSENINHTLNRLSIYYLFYYNRQHTDRILNSVNLHKIYNICLPQTMLNGMSFYRKNKFRYELFMMQIYDTIPKGETFLDLLFGMR